MTRKELLAIVTFLHQFRHYLLGNKFLIRTDHSALKWILSFKDPQGQLAKWLMTLSKYNFEIQHRPGSKHQNADTLSRKDYDDPVCLHPPDQPEENCSICKEINEQWNSFRTEVDDVTELTGRSTIRMCPEMERADKHEGRSAFPWAL